MAQYGANLELIPIFLDAPSETELIRLMVLNNQLNQQKYNYMGPPSFIQKKWIVWFYADIKEWKSPKDLSEKDQQFIQGFNR